MKRIILLAVALLVVATGCATSTAPTNSNAPAPGNMSANTAPTATPKAEATSAADSIIAQEKAIWDAIKAKSSENFGGMLADDFVYVTNDGIHDKARTVDGVKPLNITDLTLSDWKVLTLDKDVALVTYLINMKGTSGGKPIPPTPVRASSVWVNRNGKWIGVFHQDTEVKEAPASSPTPAKPTASTEAKPAASPITPAADAIAREKQLWDALKKKDYDTFANFLAEDQIEVGEMGVNDKAHSVEGVKKVDLSKAVPSDFKATTFDADTVLVTYMVKGPTPPFTKEGERSSTIWVNRGGRWLAIFHQGTPIKAAPKSK